MASEEGDLRARGELPDADDLVDGPRGQVLTVGAEREGDDAPAEAAEAADLRAGADVPQADALVVRARDQAGAVGTEHHGRDPGLVAHETGDLFARGEVPQADEPVVRGRGQAAAVGAVRHAANGAQGLRRAPDLAKDVGGDLRRRQALHGDRAPLGRSEVPPQGRQRVEPGLPGAVLRAAVRGGAQRLSRFRREHLGPVAVGGLGADVLGARRLRDDAKVEETKEDNEEDEARNAG
jgi:hypothetical protein